MSIAMRIVLLAVGALMIVFGVHLSITDGVMGLWSSISITLGFSFLVVGADEWVHAVRAQRRAAAGGVPRPH